MIGKYIRKTYLTPAYLRACFSEARSIDFSTCRPLYRKQLRTDEFQYTIEEGGARQNITLPEDSTISDLKEKLKTLSENVNNVSVLSLDLAEYANQTQLSDLKFDNHYVIVNNQQPYKVVGLDKSLAEQVEGSYQKYVDISQSLGLPFIERKIIINYLERVDVLNKEKLGKRLFADNETSKAPFSKDILVQNLIEAIISNKNQQIEREESLIQAYEKNKNKLHDLELQHQELERKAHKITKWKMSLGLFALLGQFSFVGIGTYVTYSWDIIEPLVYFINLSASIVLSAQFFKSYTDYSHNGFLDYRRKKELARLIRKYNFPLEDYNNTKELVETLERKIKSNVLINL